MIFFMILAACSCIDNLIRAWRSTIMRDGWSNIPATHFICVTAFTLFNVSATPLIILTTISSTLSFTDTI